MVRFNDVVHLVEVAVLILTLLIVGTAGFMWFEGFTPGEALHVTIATITTVGYGNPPVVTSSGQMFSNALMLFGVGIALYAFWIVADMTMGAHIRAALGVTSYKREIGRMNGHVIVCGFGRVGQAVGQRLMDQGKDFVAICQREEHFEHLPEKVPRIVGDATAEETLQEAGIERADAVVIAFGNDPDTILAIVTAKAMNPKAKVFARASHQVNAKKMLQVGADDVIVPEEEGGRRMADHVFQLPT